MKVIGLTGGVGCGKSTIAARLQKEWGADLLIADEIGHMALEKDTTSYKEILDCFGVDVTGKNGEIDRSLLAGKVFEDAERLEQLNAIIHPFVLAYIRNYIAERKGKEGILVLESAILLESGCKELCDEVWYVYASEPERKRRLMESRGYSEEKAESIMKQQLSEEQFREACDRVIFNERTGEIPTCGL